MNNETDLQGPPPLPDPEDRKQRMASDGPVKQADEKFCSNCDAVIKLKSLLCPRCGKKQSKSGMGCMPIGAIGLVIGFVGIAIIGTLAAIAIPQFAAYRTRAYQAVVKMELKEVCRAEKDYFINNDRYTDSLEELGYVAKQNISIEIVGLENDCFNAKGEMTNLEKRYYIDCDCVISDETISD